jgi:hypothetical protein
MNSDEKRFEDFVGDVRFDDAIDTEHRDRLEQELLGALAKRAPRQIRIRRTIMKTNLGKVAAAAAVIVVATTGVFLFDHFTRPAWAIDEAIDALRKFNGIHFSGTMLDEQGNEISVEAWARANSEQTAADSLRLEADTGQIDIVWEHRRYEYDPQIQTVKVTEGYGPAMDPWPGARFLESLRELVMDWDERYGKDPATGRDRVFVTCSHPAAPDPRSWQFEFDVESKLLVSMKQWENMTRQGPPGFNVKSIKYFDDLPDELFGFEIPEGAQVIEKHPFMDKLQDPNTGMLVGNMANEQACEEIAKRHWQAVIDHDWNTVALLRPIASAEDWRLKYSRNLEEIVEIGKPYEEEGCASGKIVPCTIRFKGSTPIRINMLVMLRDIDGQRSCVIGTTWPSESE